MTCDRTASHVVAVVAVVAAADNFELGSRWHLARLGKPPAWFCAPYGKA